MNNFKLEEFSVDQLLLLNALTIEELIKRGVVRTRNNPVGDYTEWLVSNKLGFELLENSHAGYDAVDRNGIRIQIKSRRHSGNNMSNQLGVFRNLDQNPFDFLVAVIFDWDYSAILAVKMPITSIKRFAKFSSHQNGYILTLIGSWVNEYSITDLFI
jgi:hypothetical protein